MLLFADAGQAGGVKRKKHHDAFLRALAKRQRSLGLAHNDGPFVAGQLFG
eukprot:CAMPEP_0177664440 /NCGR_PEP_ID=MMETSP0447-20121125/20495_1 /TAXON_ID=0 /ORGANISM="Stygamoeba regulata, Strain BSH-02190019" /LENGTH=49 /DNA_ID=CAMNT_0019170413 /DNA_START=368 /DNA_END=517 /DNA_ORIENTATION=-